MTNIIYVLTVFLLWIPLSLVFASFLKTRVGASSLRTLLFVHAEHDDISILEVVGLTGALAAVLWPVTIPVGATALLVRWARARVAAG